MANLAIKGHVTRGKEVIEILEMLGGKDVGYSGWVSQYYNYIDNFGNIIGTTELPNDRKFKIFTLEKFLEKFPYKVGDKVKTKVPDISGTVINIRWYSYNNTIVHKIECDDDTKSKLDYYVNELQPYTEQKEETMVEKENLVVVYNEHKQLKVHSLRHDRVQLMINDKYELKQEGNAYYIVKKTASIPKTFVEVLDYWHPDRQLEDDYQRSYKKNLIEKFQDLLYARDAYWKIAGEQMGLGKDWKPDFLNPTKETRYFLFCTGTTIENGQGLFPTNKILIFPTEEMRDAFYENFKELINECKELL